LGCDIRAPHYFLAADAAFGKEPKDIAGQGAAARRNCVGRSNPSRQNLIDTQHTAIEARFRAAVES
jgi:hypothetical protein